MFNTKGETVYFNTLNINEIENGSSLFNGEKLPSGLYIYKLEFNGINNKFISDGKITLIK